MLATGLLSRLTRDDEVEEKSESEEEYEEEELPLLKDFFGGRTAEPIVKMCCFVLRGFHRGGVSEIELWRLM